ncbi:MAG: hypothetical protein WAK62_22345 [Terriglobales bacterium]
MQRLTAHEEDEMNRILSRDDDILPSSGFAASVMDAVRREAAAPPPIPFPWKRALPGVVVGGLVLVWILIAWIADLSRLIGAPSSAKLSISSPSVAPLLSHGNMESAAGWIGLGLLIAFLSTKLSMRFGSGEV